MPELSNHQTRLFSYHVRRTRYLVTIQISRNNASRIRKSNCQITKLIHVHPLGQKKAVDGDHGINCEYRHKFLFYIYASGPSITEQGEPVDANKMNSKGKVYKNAIDKENFA